MGFASRDRECFEFFRSLGVQFDTFIDAGASNGWWSRSIADAFPDAAFHLFEPLADHVESYRDGLRDTTVALRSSKVHPVALGSKNGSASITVPPEPASSTLLPWDHPIANVSKVIVEVVTLDHAVATRSVPVPQALKVDTQGFELEILQGAKRTLPGIEVLLLECWLTRGYGSKTPLVHEITAYLAKRGFWLAELGDCYRDPSGRLTSQDMFFVNRRSPAAGLL